MNKKIIVNNITLSEEQRLPIIENPKTSIIIAGAGSGKSLTIVGKIKYMLDNNLIKYNEILAITYTNKAVNSLKEKITSATNCNIDVFTFHRLALNILDIANFEYNISENNMLDDIINEFFISDAFNNKVLLNYIFQYFGIIFLKTKNNYKKILNSKELNSFKKLIKTFISFMSANNLEDKWNELLKNKKYNKTLLIIYVIYNIYLSELESTNSLEFNKMISLATNIINEGKVKLPYKLIIIDEFQDTSLLRFNLIKSIIKETNSKLCVVGDDYQSIYKFQGCDLSLFLNFSKEFNNVKTYFLNETYRNSQELISIAGKFIMKNDKQIKKNLLSQKHLINPIRIIRYLNEKSILKKLIKQIPNDKEILILSRNNFDINEYLDNYNLEGDKLIIPNDIHNIKYMTIHSSKGLESDIVIVLNMKNNIYGIPSKIKDDSILSLLKNKELYPYEEERRLFYVALTRTKSYTYLLTPVFNPSIFINEISFLMSSFK